MVRNIYSAVDDPMEPSHRSLCAPFPPLVQRIEREGIVVNNHILKIDHFLNHRIETDLMAAIGAELTARLQPFSIDLIVTAEASGIPPALATALIAHLPLVYAKKYDPDVPTPALYRRIPSPTRGRCNWQSRPTSFLPVVVWQLSMIFWQMDVLQWRCLRWYARQAPMSLPQHLSWKSNFNRDVHCSRNRGFRLLLWRRLHGLLMVALKSPVGHYLSDPAAGDIP
jgi:hypothetical protein